MFEALFSHDSLGPLWRIAHWSYSSETPLWVKDSGGEIVYTIMSSNGSRQGDPLEMILYALSMHPIFKKTALLLPMTSRSLAPRLQLLKHT